MAEIAWTLEAAQCLEDIHDYIAADSPNSAYRVASGIYEKIQLLRKFPRLGQRYERITDREVREILYGHYRIAYVLINDERVELLGIFHSAMEIERFLK